MGSINEFMTKDHRSCDDNFSNLENMVADGNFSRVDSEFEKFFDSMMRHFDMEEKIIFPEFNAKNAAGCNPTGVMIMEHNQMRSLIRQMQEAIESKNQDKFLSISETFMILLQQHNMKEEQIMYNLADSVLNSNEIIEKIEAL